jgi:hypothetical protein
VEGPNCSLDPLPQALEQLLRMALTPHRCGFGGASDYLIGKLCNHKPTTAAAALGRLSLGMSMRCQVRRGRLCIVRSSSPLPRPL